MIRLEHVSKHFSGPQEEVRAVDDLTLEVEQGEFLAVRGPSGCGKSTLLSLIGGLALPTRGEVWVDQQQVSSMSSSRRAKFRRDTIGFVFQLFHLFPYLSVFNNVLVAARENGDARSRVEEYLDRFGLSQRSRHFPGQLSAGERQRVAMARALLNRPKLLLADEPAGNLDPENARIVLDLLAEFHQSGGTVVLVTHDQLAADQAQRVIHIQQGQLVGG